ncbi:MAG TPA: acyltransferase [Phormidium sp.]
MYLQKVPANIPKQPLTVNRIRKALANRFRILKNRLFLPITKLQNVGKKTYIDSSVQVSGWRNTRIGQNSILSENIWINVNHRGSKEPSVIIGDYCFIGRRNFFTSGKIIEIGSYCLTGVDCKFLGSGHLYDSPFVPYIASGTAEDGVIKIGSNCWLGANVTILKNVTVGYGCIIGAGTVVNRNIPPLSVVVGNPCRIVKRFDMTLKSWVSAKDYADERDQELLSEAEYLEILNETKFDMQTALVASSRKFGDL